MCSIKLVTYKMSLTLISKIVLSKIMKNPQLSIKEPSKSPVKEFTKPSSKPTSEKSKVSITKTDTTINEIWEDIIKYRHICLSKLSSDQPTEMAASTAVETSVSTAMEIENSSTKTLTNELSVAKKITNETPVAKELTNEASVAKKLSSKETSNEVVELLFTVKPEPNDEIEDNTLSRNSSNACESRLVFLNNAFDDLACSSSELKVNKESAILDSVHNMNEDVLKLQETIDIKQTELQWAKERIKYLEEQLMKTSADPKLVKEAAKSMAVKALNEAITKITDEEDKPSMITSVISDNEKPKDLKMVKIARKPIVRGLECPKYHQLISKIKTTSNIWQFYGLPADEDGKILSKDIAVCKLCKTPVSLKSGSTSNIRSHLKLYHPHQFKNLL